MKYRQHKNEIRNELEKILTSRAFSRSPLLSNFLKFVVEETLEENENQIKEYTVGIKALNKPQYFNPQLDASVRINAIRLRKMLSDYYQSDGLNTNLRIELPKGSYIPAFSSSTNDSNIQFQYLSPPLIAVNDMVGILPFTGFVHHPSLDFSITGFCKFLSEKLSLFQDIGVVSFHSVSRFMKENGNLEQIGSELGLNYYLTGSIEIETEQIRVTYQLFEASTQSHVWSQQMQTPLLDNAIVEAIDTISSQIVASLAGYSGFIHYNKFLDKSHIPPISNQMANAIFWFYHYQVNHTRELFYNAVNRLESVLAEDSNCSLCWAVLAHLYADSLMYNYSDLQNPLETAIAYMEKSLQLDPENQHGHLVKAWVQLLLGQKEEVLKSIEKINKLNPNSSTFIAMCSFGLAFLGEYEKSLQYLKQARLLNPLPFWWMNFPEMLVALKNNEYQKLLFFAQKPGTPPQIYEHVFEMIGHYYLGNTRVLKEIVSVYSEKYPGGIAFINNALPAIIFDKELAGKISFALQEIAALNLTGQH